MITDIKLVGVNYISKSSKILLKNAKDSLVIFKREPTNAYDKNAIKLYLVKDDSLLAKIGYVSRDRCLEVLNAWLPAEVEYGYGHLCGTLKVSFEGTITADQIHEKI